MTKETGKKFEVFKDGSSEQDHSQTVEQAPVDVSKEKADQAEKLLEARTEVTKESSEKDKILDKLNIEEESHEDEATARPVGKDLKKLTLQKEMSHIRHKLSKGDRVGSRLIHQPIIKAVSEVSSKTITRPSGLLGGGITAVIGTSTYLYLTKHIGIRYNYAIFLFLLVAGFILGLIIEAVLRMARGKRSI